jgi:hypothetical protein
MKGRTGRRIQSGLMADLGRGWTRRGANSARHGSLVKTLSTTGRGPSAVASQLASSTFSSKIPRIVGVALRIQVTVHFSTTRGYVEGVP